MKVSLRIWLAQIVASAGQPSEAPVSMRATLQSSSRSRLVCASGICPVKVTPSTAQYEINQSHLHVRSEV
eukprot:5406647-Amphidinium_carterae.1